MLIASPELAVRSGQDEAPVIRLPRPAPGPILPWPWRDSGYPPRRTRGHPPRRHHDTTRQLERTPWPRLGTPARPPVRTPLVLAQVIAVGRSRPGSRPGGRSWSCCPSHVRAGSLVVDEPSLRRHGDNARGSHRLVVMTTCQSHGATGFTNLLVTKEDGVIVLNPHAANCCVLRLDVQAATALHSTAPSESGWGELGTCPQTPVGPSAERAAPTPGSRRPDRFHALSVLGMGQFTRLVCGYHVPQRTRPTKPHPAHIRFLQLRALRNPSRRCDGFRLTVTGSG